MILHVNTVFLMILRYVPRSQIITKINNIEAALMSSVKERVSGAAECEVGVGLSQV